MTGQRESSLPASASNDSPSSCSPPERAAGSRSKGARHSNEQTTPGIINGATHMVITGATGGIGAALVREFAARGSRLTLVGRDRDALERLAVSAGTAVYVAQCDLLQPGGRGDWIAAAERSLGPIDVLVNNAGRVAVGRFGEVDAGDARAVLELDLAVPLELTRRLLPGMLARGSGTIVNIASTGALAPAPGMADYCAAKSGLAAASETLRAELRGSGVHVLTVYPGPTETRMLRAAHAGYPALRRVTRLPAGTPEALARRIRLAIEKGRPRVIHPHLYHLFRWFPRLARWLVGRFTPAPLAREELETSTTSHGSHAEDLHGR